MRVSPLCLVAYAPHALKPKSQEEKKKEGKGELKKAKANPKVLRERGDER